ATSCYINESPAYQLYALSLHDALPILIRMRATAALSRIRRIMLPDICVASFKSSALSEITTRYVPNASSFAVPICSFPFRINSRSEEHTSELQSRFDLVCRLLLDKKNK